MEGTPEIAIVGMACRVPGASTPGELWENLRDGVESIERLSEAALLAAGVSAAALADPHYVRACAQLAGPDRFDAGFWGLSPREAAILDPQHRHFLECAWEALEDAACVPERFDGRIGVFAGSGHNAYFARNLLTNPGLVRSVGHFLLRHTGNDKDFLATRVSHLLDLRGPSVAVQTACSTSLVAVHMACQSLLAWECDAAVAGAASINLPLGHGYLYRPGEILSPDGHCRAFDAGANGTVFGSGVAMVVLRRLDDALADGDPIHAVIKGSAINNDGRRKAGYLAPSVDGQAAAIAEALEVADVAPETVGLVEGHGTGTRVGDPIEVAALTQAFRAKTGRTGYCALGSIKPNLGHLDTAAGLVSLIKAVLCIQHGAYVPTLHFQRPNPECRLETSPFWVPSTGAAWPGDGPRRAGVSSLGVGGTNAHVILEEAPTSGPPPAARAWEIVPFSAMSTTALAARRAQLAACVEPVALSSVVATTVAGRRAMPHRGFLRVSRGGEVVAPEAHGGRTATPTVPVFLFAGGGVAVARAESLLSTDPDALATVEMCLSHLPAPVHQGVREALLESHDRELAQRNLRDPALGLPALFLAQLAHARFLIARGVRPGALLGHSMGEYTAAHLAGVLGLEDALKLVVARGELLSGIGGGMTSVAEEAAAVRARLSPELSLAAINAPGLCVVSGPTDALGRLEAHLDRAGVAHRRLHIDVGAHSALLDPVLERFRARVTCVTLAPPELPIISSLTGDWLTEEQATDPDYWVQQLRGTVRFAASLDTALREDRNLLVDVGPGSVAAALARLSPHATNRRVLSTSSKDGSELAAALDAVGHCFVAGVELDLEAPMAPRAHLPTYPFEGTRHWFDREENADAPAAQAGRLPLTDWFHVPEWTPSGPVPDAAPGPALVFSDGSDLAARIMAALVARGPVATVMRGDEMQLLGSAGVYTVRGREDFAALCDATAARSPRHVIYLWALDGGGDGGFADLVALAKAWRSWRGAELTLTVVTCALHPVSISPEAALALGPVRVIPAEFPHVRARLVALDADNVDAAAVADVVTAPATASLLRLDGAVVQRRRWRRESLRPRPPGASRLQGGAYVITGGLGALGLNLAEHLARKGARLALIGRSGLPARGQWARWRSVRPASDRTTRILARVEAMESIGAQVMAISADVADIAQMRQALGQVRARFGTIDGVFHAAGTLDDGLLALKAPEAMEPVLRPKVQGTRVLDRLLRDSEARFLVLFSSVSGLVGFPGQVDYAAANAFLDAFAHSRRDSPGPWTVSVDWAAWREIGMAAALADDLGLGTEPGERVAHPLLQTARSGRFVAALDASHWLLAEHRTLAGVPVLPGTAFVETARAAACHGGFAPWAVEDLVLMAPFAVPEARRELRTELTPLGSSHAFAIKGRAGEEAWVEHARGLTRPLRPADAASPLDLHALRARLGPRREVQGVSSRHLMQFGPRWDSLRAVHEGAGEMLMELELGATFHEDLEALALHPALLDLAAAGAQSLIPHATRGDDGLYVPWSFRAVRAHGRLRARCWSHVRLRGRGSRGLAEFDATVVDEAGKVLVEVEGLVLKRVDSEGFGAPKRRPSVNAPLRASLELGIRPAEGVEALERLLAAGLGPQVVVTPEPLHRLTGGTATPAPTPAAAHNRPERPVVAPRTPMEAHIAEVVRGLLGVDTVSVDDDFFALGGHSLLAVHLFATLERTTGLNRPLSTLFSAPTVALLAREFGGEDPREGSEKEQEAAPDSGGQRQRTDGPADSREVSAGGNRWRSLVALRAKGSNRPLFCMHGRGGNVLNYRALLAHLGEDQPVYGLQARGLDGDDVPFGTLEEMAAHYIQEIRTVQAHGPYLLGGGSMGGTLAYEMAQQLLADGEPTALVAMFDTYGPHFFEFSVAGEPVGSLQSRALSHVQALAEMGPGGQLGYIADRVKARVDARLRSARAATNRALGRSLPHDLRYWEVERRNLELLAAYQPRPYHGRVTIFRAAHQPEGVYADPNMGWGGLALGALEVVPVPGDHDTLVEQPQLGIRLRAALARVGASLR